MLLLLTQMDRAIVWSLLLSSGYVIVLYIQSSTRPTSEIRRDDYVVVCERLKVISLYTGWVLVAVWLIGPTTHELGLTPIHHYTIHNVFKYSAITVVLFIGPVVDYIIRRYRDKTLLAWPKHIAQELNNVYGIRNFVIGPVSEELVFRSCIIAVNDYHSWEYLVFVTPLWFGAAHIHHAYEEYLTREKTIKVILVQTTLHFVITTLFGWYSAYLFVHTGTVYSSIAVHIFCNAIGPPGNPLNDDRPDLSTLYSTLLIGGLMTFAYLIYNEGV